MTRVGKGEGRGGKRTGRKVKVRKLVLLLLNASYVPVITAVLGSYALQK